MSKNNTKLRQAEDDADGNTVQLSMRLPEDLFLWVNKMAKDNCNSNSGIVKLAVVNFRKSINEAKEREAKLAS